MTSRRHRRSNRQRWTADGGRRGTDSPRSSPPRFARGRRDKHGKRGRRGRRNECFAPSERFWVFATETPLQKLTTERTENTGYKELMSKRILERFLRQNVENLICAVAKMSYKPLQVGKQSPCWLGDCFASLAMTDFEGVCNIANLIRDLIDFCYFLALACAYRQKHLFTEDSLI